MKTPFVSASRRMGEKNVGWGGVSLRLLRRERLGFGGRKKLGRGGQEVENV